MSSVPEFDNVTAELREQAKKAGIMLEFDSDSQACSMGDSVDDIGGKCVGFHLERMANNAY
jgi:hypothetical protein